MALTEQQAFIRLWANRGYPARDIAKVLGRSPAQVADQVRLIRKKGYDVRLLSAKEAADRVDASEARRIADVASWVREYAARFTDGGG